MKDDLVRMDVPIVADTTVPAAVAPSSTVAAAAPVPPQRRVAAWDAVPAPETGLDPLPGEAASTWDVLGAAWNVETIRTDAWNYLATKRRDLANDVFSRLPKDAKERVWGVMQGTPGQWTTFEEEVLKQAGTVVATDPTRFGDLPLDINQFNARIEADRKAEFDENQSVLDRKGGGLAEFVGSSGRAMTDQASLMLLPFGIGGSAFRTIAGEAVLGAAGEAAVLPREFQVAEEMGLPAPSAIDRILMGAALGGGLSAGLIGLGKGISRYTTHRAAARDAAKLSGDDAIDAELAIDAAEGQLRGDQTVQEVTAPPKPEKGTLGDILSRNASTRAPEDVVIDYDLGGKTRDKPVSEDFLGRLRGAVAPLGDGIGVKIVSGGQDAIGTGGKRTGSTRHDVDPSGEAQTADVVLTRNGMVIKPTEDKELYGRFLYEAAKVYPGIGHYDWGIHVGGGSVAAWGPTTSARSLDPYFGDAIAAGRTGNSGWKPGPTGDAPAVANSPGLDYNEDAVLNSIVGVESGGNVSTANPNSSALGLGQMISGTWMELVQKHRPDLLIGRTPNEVLALREDGKLSREMTRAYMRDNTARLKSSGLPAGPGEVYLAHFMGPSGAVRALQSPLDTPISTLMTPKEIAANANVRWNGRKFADFTAVDLRAWSNAKMRGGAAQRSVSAAPNTDGYTTSSGYTRQGQISAGEDFRIDVDYEVVDLSSLIRASGDFQPRDRSRVSSDAWIAETAARLDPAQLMPSPTADRGTPIVGPDNMIESGNGRFGAIERAYDYHPDRGQAYRAQIETAGYSIPDGMDRPVLIARRRTPLNDDQRKSLVIDAQDSGVAQMTPSEIARASSRVMTGPVLARLDPSVPLQDALNTDFVRGALAGLPRSARNGLYDKVGALSTFGQQVLRQALFARAWPDPDILARFTESDAGELKSLLQALDQAAPSWAALKADIASGLVRPEMDLSGFVLDAMRLIGAARDLSAKQGLSIGKAVAELLDEVDLIEGAIAPLTAAFVRRFWQNGRAAPADDVASFLTRYATDARRAGTTDALFDGPTPKDILTAIDPKSFGDLPADLGNLRGFATPSDPSMGAVPDGYDLGATSPEALAADAAIADSFVAAANTDGLTDLIRRGATAEEIEAHPMVADAIARAEAIEPTTNLPQYGEETFWTSRKYLAGDQELVGIDAAVDYLQGASRKLGWTEDGLQPPAKIAQDRKAVILLGAPSAGKSSIANPFARELKAAIIDGDEAKKLIPEFQGGLGAGAVHDESMTLANLLLARATQAGDNLIIPKVGGSPKGIKAVIDRLRAAGYQIDVHLVDVAPDEAWRRMIGRFQKTGRLIPPKVLKDGIDGAPKTYDLLKAEGYANGFAKIDNSPGLGQPRGIVEDVSSISPAFLGRDGSGGNEVAGLGVRAGSQDAGGQGRGTESSRVAQSDPDPDASVRAQVRSDLGAMRDGFAEFDITMPDGSTARVGDVLDDLDRDAQANAGVQGCAVSPGGSQ